jgi:adenosylcobinamide kinase/adenosylcobinamide-phosphate guanylyltransferase
MSGTPARDGLILVLGGARSGKSAVAQRLAEQSGAPVVYVGTLAAGDAEMAGRIARHRRMRPAAWRTIESGTRLPEELATIDEGTTVLIDGLGGWISAELLAARPDAAESLDPRTAAALDERVRGRIARLVEVAGGRRGLTIVVSEEAGMGVVPPYPLGRLFRDLLGEANAALAVRAARVLLVVAGLPLDLRRLAERDLLVAGDDTPGAAEAGKGG